MASLEKLMSLVSSSHPSLTSTLFSLGDRNVVIVKQRQLERLILDSTVQMFCCDCEAGDSVEIKVLTFSKKLIHRKIVNTESSLQTVLTEFQKIDCRVCEGFQPEDVDQVDLNSILIEKYNDHLLYRSKNCLYISQRSNPTHCCSNCQFLKRTSSSVVVSMSMLPTSESESLPILREEVEEGQCSTKTPSVILLNSYTWPVNWTGQPSLTDTEGSSTGKTLLKKKARGRPIVYDHPCNVVDCNEIFSNFSDLKEHKKSKHEDLFKCSWPNSSCSKSFAAQEDLEKHLGFHSSEPPYKCDQCAKGFSSKKVFKQHMKLHSNIKSYTCEVCNKSFARKDGLSVHQSVHTKERPYLCLKCGKSFSRQSHLNEHNKRTHQEVRRYLCLTCSKAFFTSQQLSRHSRVHSRERPYQCNKCDKSFTRDHHLKVHIERLHETKT